MKKITLFLLSCVLLATACNQSNTTPTTPPANPCGYSTNSNEYIELKINGKTLRNENVTASGVNINSVKAMFQTDTTTPPSRSLGLLASECLCPLNSSVINNMKILSGYIDKLANPLDPIGVYTGSGGYIDYYKGIADVKRYNIDSITVTVNTCTADYVSGTFTGTAIEQNTLISYPFTGSFQNLQRNGF